MDNDKTPIPKLNVLYLVSDDSSITQQTNSGVTLPNEETATYNIGLSPLFINRIGFGAIGEEPAANRDRNIHDRGQDSFIASSVSSNPSRIYFAIITDYNVTPSYKYDRRLAYSLRCLVSTNNSIIIK